MNNIKQVLKKQWSNILLGVFVVLLVVPQTGRPIKVALHKLISFAPDTLSTKDQLQLDTYNWPLETAIGEQVNFSQSKNRVVVVNFWATWCPPCIAEMPSFQALYNSFESQVDFYFVTTEDPARVQAFLNKKEYTFPVYYQETTAPRQMQTTALPTTYVLNKAGTIVIEETGAADWNAKSVNQLLSDLLAE